MTSEPAEAASSKLNGSSPILHSDLQ